MTTYESSPFSKGVWGAPSDAEFRAWGAACEAAIAAVLTEVSSTVDWATATIPTTPANTFNAGDTATYRFNDGGTEVYIKFDWGRGSITGGAAGQFALRVQVGKDSGMAQATTTHYLIDGVAAAFSDGVWAASFSDGCFVLTATCGQYGATSAPPLVVVERSRDYDGAPNGDGVLCVISGLGINSSTASTNAGLSHRRLHFDPFAVLATDVVGWSSPAFATAAGNVDAAVAPLWGTGAGEMSAMRSLMVVRNSTTGALQNITLNFNGTNRQYRSAHYTGAGWGDSSTERVIYRWE